jgi:hypothetical protein
MKKLLVLALLVVFVFGCEPPGQVVATGDDQVVSPGGEVNAGRPSGVLGPFPDESDQVELYYHWAVGYGYQNNVSVGVGANEVLVGGGAYVQSQGGLSVGGLLTGSCPYWDDPDAGNYCIGWTGQSKNHIISWYHGLLVYAIGMKLKKVPRSYWKDEYIPREIVQNYVRYDSAYSSLAQHPTARVECPGTWMIISGGAMVLNTFGDNGSGTNPYGNYLTASYWDGIGGNGGLYDHGGAWVASSKDHIYASPAIIMAIAISIANGPIMNNAIPNFGDMRVIHINSASLNTTATRPGRIDMSSGYSGTYWWPSTRTWCVTGAGALDQYNGMGRMLTGINVSPWGSVSTSFGCSVYVTDKDHIYGDTSLLTAQLTMIQFDYQSDN